MYSPRGGSMPDPNKMHLAYLLRKNLVNHEPENLPLDTDGNYNVMLYFPKLNQYNYKNYIYKSIDSIPAIEDTFKQTGFKLDSTNNNWSLKTTTDYIRWLKEDFWKLGIHECRIL